MRPKVWKILAYLVGMFAAMVLPIIPFVVMGFLGPPPYLLREDRLGPEWVTPRQFADGSTVAVHTYSDEVGARDGASAVLGTISRKSTEYTPSRTRYTRRDNDRRGLVLPVGNRVLHIEGANDATVDARLEALPFVVENPEKGPLGIFFRDYLVLFLLGFALFLLLWFYFLFRGGAWAASVDPPPGLTPVSAEALRARLLEINALKLPFHVREEPNGRLVAEWRIADAAWVGLLEAGGLRMVHQVYLELDPAAHVVRSQDRDRNISWSGGVARLGWSFAFFRGISLFQYERGAAVGLFFKDGQWTTTAYNYRFALAEMKNPLIEAIVQSGWRFAPVITFFRPLGG